MSFLEVMRAKLGYHKSGAATGEPPLVFLHGVGSDKSVWARQIEFFANARTVIAFDYPGYGESDLPAQNLNRREIAEQLIEALRLLKIEQAHFCGLSMGGVIALEIYKQQPQLVASLILANTFAKHPAGAEIVGRARDFLKNGTMREFAEQRVGALLTTAAPDALRAQVIETMARISKQTYAWASPAVWTADYLDLLPEIKVPTLVIGSDFDQPTPLPLSRELTGKIPNAQLAVIENAGHLSNLEQPETFNRLIQEFI